MRVRAEASLARVRGLPGRLRRVRQPTVGSEAPAISERTSVGLDVHARSVVACVIDGETGVFTRTRFCPDYGEIHRWLLGLAGPLRVVYEAGPTGFGLARWASSVWWRGPQLDRPAQPRHHKCPAGAPPMVAARGTNPRLDCGQPPQGGHARSGRPAETFQPNSPSCGNQPAHISSDRASPKTRWPTHRTGRSTAQR